MVNEIVIMLALISAPSITTSSSMLSHGGTITVTGINFGTKSPAAPLMWDGMTSVTTNSLGYVTRRGYSEVMPPQGSSIKASWDMQYRTPGFRNIPAPHARSSYYLVGGHYNEGNDTYSNVGVTVDAGSVQDKWYAKWYVRHSFPIASTDLICYADTQTNMASQQKDWVIQSGNSMYTNQMHYNAYVGSVPYSTTALLGGYGYDNQGALCGSSDKPALAILCNSQYRQNENVGWVSREITIRDSDGFYSSINTDGNSRIEESICSCGTGTSLYPLDADHARSFSIGGFMKVSDWAEALSRPIRAFNTDFHEWIANQYNNDVFYLRFKGYDQDGVGNPNVVEPLNLKVGSTEYTLVSGGVPSTLNYSEFWYGDDDGLGFSTIYVRLTNGLTPRNPTSHGDCFIRSHGNYSNADTDNGRLHEKAFRYYSDIYVDNKWSRVMLCNNSDHTSATICEPQIPRAWADGQITATVNLGALTGCTAYLHVFDDTNTSSSSFPINICTQRTTFGTGGTRMKFGTGGTRMKVVQ